MEKGTEQYQFLRSLVGSLSAELKSTFASYPAGKHWSKIALMEVTRGLNYYYSMGLWTQGEIRPGPFYYIGASYALAIFMEGANSSLSLPVVPSSKALWDWADSALTVAGQIVTLSRYLDLCDDGFFRIEQPSPERYIFRATRPLIDTESFDTADQDWLRRKLMPPEELGCATSYIEVESRIKRLVAVSHKHYVGYKTDEVIDSYYVSAGIYWAERLEGGFELPSDAKIGGLPFYMYRAAVAVACNLALKHMEYAINLMKLRSEKNLRNLLSSWHQSSKPYLESFQSFLNVDKDDASKLLDALTLTVDYASKFGSVPNGPLPPFIQLGKKGLSMNVSGCLDSPFWFLLRRLRYLYPQDWDKIIDGREEDFRDQLFQMFSRRDGIQTKNLIRIRKGRRELTDVDAVVFDSTTGTLLLFQLKWQDPFGHSIRERRSKMNNLIAKANEWVGLVSDWINEDRQELYSKLAPEIRTRQTPVSHVELVVLVRHHIRFTGAPPSDSRAAWGTWPQLSRLVSGCTERDPLKWLTEQLRAEWTREEAPRRVPTGEFLKINGITIEVTDGF